MTANTSASRCGIRSSGRTSTTTPDPFERRAKKSGACRRRPSVVPGQPERLGGHRHHRRVEVHQHHVVAFEPGLIPHVLTRRGEPPPTGEARHPLGEPERAHRRRALEPHPCAGLQRLPSRHAVRTDVVHGEPNTWKIYNRFSGPTHQHPKITKKINGCNCSGKDNPDGIRSTGKGSDQMARDAGGPTVGDHEIPQVGGVGDHVIPHPAIT